MTCTKSGGGKGKAGWGGGSGAPAVRVSEEAGCGRCSSAEGGCRGLAGPHGSIMGAGAGF